jgi:3'-5' exoribonuclease 1
MRQYWKSRYLLHTYWHPDSAIICVRNNPDEMALHLMGRNLTRRAQAVPRPIVVDDVVKAVVAGARRIVVVDVEATCWKKGVFSRKKETIEIGAVKLLLGCAESKWPEFQTFVRPQRLPRLSSFCRELTGITQENVDTAPTFPEALRLFLDWSQPLERVVLATWSRYDLWQLDLDLEAHELPKLALPLLDVKKLAARLVGAKSLEETALQLVPDVVGMPRHRAIADARRTARILNRLLRPSV